MNSSNSCLSSASSPESSQKLALQQYVCKVLKSKIFLGRYVERRLVNEAIGYRDIIFVSAAEEELQRDLVDITDKLSTYYSATTHWIGITDTENLSEYKNGICLWTELEDKPFGPFWFQIKSVQFRVNEIMIQVKCLRYITERFLELEPFLVSNEKINNGFSKNSGELTISPSEILMLAKNNITLKNIKEIFVFLVALLIGAITGSVALVSYLGNFVLSLVRELSNLVQNSTPLLLGSLDFMSKIVGGFYILIAMIFRQSTPKPTPNRYIEYDSINTSNKPKRSYSFQRQQDFD